MTTLGWKPCISCNVIDTVFAPYSSTCCVKAVHITCLQWMLAYKFLYFDNLWVLGLQINILHFKDCVLDTFITHLRKHHGYYEH